MAHANVPARKQQVGITGWIKAAQGNGVHLNRNLRTVILLRLESVGRVKIQVPPAVERAVLKRSVLQNILLGQYFFRDKAPALPLARHVSLPAEGQTVRVIASAVFDIVPDTGRKPLQLQTNLLGLTDGVRHSSGLKPPVVAAVHLLIGDPAALSQQLLDGFPGISIVGGDVGNRMVFPLGEEKQRAPKGGALLLHRRKGLPVGVSALLAHPVGQPGHGSQGPVSGGVDIIRALKPQLLFRHHLKPRHPGDPALAVRLHPADVRIQIQLQIGLRQDLFQEHVVPEHRIAFLIQIEIAEL